jgi:hypothetical protein
MEFRERTTAPAVNNKYYVRTTFGGLNKCILIDQTTGSVLPNCVGYAYGRFMESAGLKTCKLPTGDAGTWYGSVTYSKGRTPKLGAVACWTGGTAGKGHVAVVEHIDGSMVTVSESGYYSKVRFQRRTMSPPYDFNGLSFQGFIYNPAFMEGKMAIPEGRFEADIDGIPVIGYGQRAGQRLGMISAEGNPPLRALQTIGQIDDQSVTIYASMNANYFQMATDQSDPYGTHYGTEISLTNHFTPHKGNVLAYAVMLDGKSFAAPDNEFWYTKDEVQFACAPAHIAYLRGNKVDLWSSAFRASKEGPNTQSMLIRTADRFALAVVSEKVTIEQCVSWAEKNVDGLLDLCFMDSGGSSQIMIGYEFPVYTGRMIPNVLSFFRAKDELSQHGETEPDEQIITEPEKPQEQPETGSDEIVELRRENFKLKDKLERIRQILDEQEGEEHENG